MAKTNPVMTSPPNRSLATASLATASLVRASLVRASLVGAGLPANSQKKPLNPRKPPPAKRPRASASTRPNPAPPRPADRPGTCTPVRRCASWPGKPASTLVPCRPAVPRTAFSRRTCTRTSSSAWNSRPPPAGPARRICRRSTSANSVRWNGKSSISCARWRPAIYTAAGSPFPTSPSSTRRISPSWKRSAKARTRRWKKRASSSPCWRFWCRPARGRCANSPG